MVEINEVKDAGKRIKENLDQDIIDKGEITDTQKDVDLLKKEKDNAPEKEVKEGEKELTAEQKVWTEALKIWNKYSDALKDAIIAYFKPAKTDKVESKIPDIAKDGLNSELITNYIKTLTALKRENTENAENAENKKDAENTERNNRIDAIIKALEKKWGDITRTENEKKTNTLLDMLNSDPTVNSKEKTEALFENNPSMRESIFTNKDKLSDQQKENLNQFLQIYSGCTKTEDGKWTYKGGTVDMTKFSYTITESAGDLNYKTGEKYIQISFDVKSEENKVEKTTKITKDIMFGKEVKVIEEARANKSIESNTAKIAPDKKLTIANIWEMQETWSYQYLRKLVAADKVDLTKSLEWDLLKNIKTYYAWKAEGTEKDLNIENKEDGYYTTIAELVVEKAQAGDAKPLQEYLKHVNSANMDFLWRTPEEQKKNYEILVKAVTLNSNYDANSQVRQDIRTKLLDIQNQVLPEQNIADQLKNWAKEFFKAYGEGIIKLLNFLGIGKSKLLDICKRFGISTKEVDEHYAKMYGLEDKKVNASKEIVEDIDKTYTREKDKAPALDEPGKIQTEFKDNILKFYTVPQQKIFFENMEPTMLQNLITTYNADESHKNSPIKVQDYLIKNGKGKREIKKWANMEGLKAAWTSLMNILVNDKSTWTNIYNANEKIKWRLIKEGSTELTRSDLETQQRKDLQINKPSDIAKYFNYYAFSGKTGDLDYVITETKKVPEKIETPVEKKYTVLKDVNFRKDGDANNIHEILKVNTEITAILDKWQEITSTGKGLQITDKELSNKPFIKVSCNGHIWWIVNDPEFLKTKPAELATTETPEKQADKDKNTTEKFPLSANFTYEDIKSNKDAVVKRYINTMDNFYKTTFWDEFDKISTNTKLTPQVQQQKIQKLWKQHKESKEPEEIINIKSTIAKKIDDYLVKFWWKTNFDKSKSNEFVLQTNEKTLWLWVKNIVQPADKKSLIIGNINALDLTKDPTIVKVGEKVKYGNDQKEWVLVINDKGDPEIKNESWGTNTATLIENLNNIPSK